MKINGNPVACTYTDGLEELLEWNEEADDEAGHDGHDEGGRQGDQLITQEEK